MKKIYVAKSKYHGKGIFAGQDFHKGEVVFIMKGEVIKYHPKNKRESCLYPNAVGIGADTWINPSEPYKYINHSCEPNLATKGKVTFVAIRNIKQGEELTFDYSISEASLWDMKCKCRSSKCRKIIRGIQYLPEKYYRKYLPFIPTYFQYIHDKKNTKLITK